MTIDTLSERLRRYRGGDTEYRRLMDEAAEALSAQEERIAEAREAALAEAAGVAASFNGLAGPLIYGSGEIADAIRALVTKDQTSGG